MHGLSRAVLMTAALATVAGGPVATPTLETPRYFPAGVADAAGSVGCARTPDGGVEALDLASGKRRWRSAAPARALLVAREGAFLLEERGGRLQLSRYEPRTGRRLGTWPIRLEQPAWVSLAEPHADRRWTTFDVHAHRNGSTLEVEYLARQHLVLGIQPGPRTEGKARGVIRLELRSGRVEHRPGERLARDPWLEPAPAAGPD